MSKTIQARYVTPTDRGYHMVKVRRANRFEALDPRTIPADVKFRHGDRLNVIRQANNPYLVFVSKA